MTNERWKITTKISTDGSKMITKKTLNFEGMQKDHRDTKWLQSEKNDMNYIEKWKWLIAQASVAPASPGFFFFSSQQHQSSSQMRIPCTHWAAFCFWLCSGAAKKKYSAKMKGVEGQHQDSNWIACFGCGVWKCKCWRRVSWVQSQHCAEKNWPLHPARI